ncbi:PREDICTED: receptor-like serine/threonine-protein kinase SD1-6 [Theobroma cacao]|uniref:Receptor-like serine/threonine-protein kinase n=1 Tax=Theobroma cacao TaxID=3641 RepID=A0AB32X3X5_THECC|nr:PREDICTED: receptor-like serine/threonine-protein kinase SD1-6 [Theobroma cacao]
MRRSSLFSHLSLLVFVCLAFKAINGTDTIEQGQPIAYPSTIISAGGKFELGFFSPGNNSKYYVGIWHKVSNRSIVWVANRDHPFPSESSVLSINTKGKLVISDGRMFYMVTNVKTSRNTYATLLDSGNLVLLNNNTLEVLWQSFDDTTNTILPGMTVQDDYRFSINNWSIVSWRSVEDPAPGSFSLERELDVAPGRKLNFRYILTIKKGSKLYWTDTRNAFWRANEFGRRFTSEFLNTSRIAQIVLDEFGQLKLQSWSEDDQRWHTLESSKCSYHRCGVFSICNITTDTPCSCLRGFKPISATTSIENGTYKGCVRKTNLQCTNSGDHVQNDEFLPKFFVDYPSDEYVLDHTSSAADCKVECLSNCSCIAYAYDIKRGCLVWYGDLFDLKQLPESDVNGKNFYLKLAASELITSDTSSTNGITEDQKEKTDKRQLWTIVILSLSLSMLVLGFCIYFVSKKLQSKGEDLLKFDLAMSLKADDTDLKEASKPGIHRKNESKLPFFSFASVSAATDNFSVTNKLGEGGFGPVYKGILLKGDEIAVKRLSRRSGQGWEELKNEALLIAKLQHKNLVRLLGCCIERDEKILIYEYMENKSLDFLLFDSIKRKILDWPIRARITEGIAQGLLYLHQYSRLPIIHRDLKASNILLDSNMNPKISDFGMARIFGGGELKANTNRIVGTYGYMSPEYALEGLFSVKSDVFSFGVLLLEIVSGRKNTGFYQSKSLHLLGYAWDLWTRDRALDLIDPMLEEVPTHLALRYVNIGLLCVQDNADDRPTMSSVVSMLNNETMALPSPKQPAFLNARSMVNQNLVENGSEICSVNDVTFSVLEAR